MFKNEKDALGQQTTLKEEEENVTMAEVVAVVNEPDLKLFDGSLQGNSSGFYLPQLDPPGVIKNF